MNPANDTLDLVARTSYGRLLAYLSARSGDIAGAEDALSGALHAALRTWPDAGIPDKPEAWLMQAAKRLLIDEARQNRSRAQARSYLARETAASYLSDFLPDIFPDERLRLLFLCAHPAIDREMHTPLMLQLALGFDAAKIASAFLVSPATMAQRLVRAKAKIRATRIPLATPEPEQLPERLEAVLEAVYAAFSQGWYGVFTDDLASAESQSRSLTREAIYLCRLLSGMLPGEPEPCGLLALMLHCEARRGARRGPTGDFIPLLSQDTARWSNALIDEAETHLARAGALGRPGRFQLEAAIQSLHSQQAFTGVRHARALALLYRGLTQTAPTVGAFVGLAVAVAAVEGAMAGLSVLDALPPKDAASYQPYWAARAALCAEAGQIEEALRAYQRATGLTEDAGVRRFLHEKQAQLLATRADDAGDG